jgi:hypothetical protein
MKRVAIGTILICLFFLGVLRSVSVNKTNLAHIIFIFSIPFLLPGILFIYFGFRSFARERGQKRETMISERGSRLSEINKESSKQKISPSRSDPLENLLEFVRSWMESSPPVPADGKLKEFMDSYANTWHVGWYRGTAEKAYDWLRKCVKRDFASPGRRDLQIIHIDASSYKGRYGKVVFDKPSAFWKKYGVGSSAIQVGASGKYHVIGKASNEEYYYLGHQYVL